LIEAEADEDRCVLTDPAVGDVAREDGRSSPSTSIAAR
jgi:hypothetical protein